MNYMICQSESKGSNKFWAYDRISDVQVRISWGRLGTNGQFKTHTKPHKYALDRFLNGKISEKARKGYTEIEENLYKILHAQSAALGSRHKIYDQRWSIIQFMDDRGDHNMVSLKFVEDTALIDPDVTPALFLKAEIKQKSGLMPIVYTLLITSDNVYELDELVPKGTYPGYSAQATPASTKHPDLQKVMDALQQGIAIV